MNIERVRVLKTLKTGDKIWTEGVYNKPIAPELIAEIRAGSSIIEILATDVVQPPSVVPSEVEEQEEKRNCLKQIASLEKENSLLKDKIRFFENEKTSVKIEAESEIVDMIEKKVRLKRK